ncbi:uncharacterized protein LOC128245002 [Mya arenaria]|uniref:uncharacterized protein LOC128245002 n=1 Tax=Mya arenaria TaxID=6604 RepID=UPI0022E6EC64|nr:uncharacterized protein LOC128245002 [Mya arenaria]XP_052819148.1 uncharacterized protein LOC128245002 [Mya arenaria]
MTSLALFVLSSVATAAGFNYTCLQCEDAYHPYSCTTVQHCGPHEVCAMEAYWTSATLQYRLKCTDELFCSTGALAVGRRSSSETVLCFECCHGNLCNMKTCKTVLDASVGPVCYSCNSTLGIEDCNQVKHCALDEICQISLLPRIPGLEMERYSTGCIPKHSSRCNPSNPAVSDADGFTNSPVCSSCCDTDLCNAFNPCTSTPTSATTFASTSSAISGYSSTEQSVKPPTSTIKVPTKPVTLSTQIPLTTTLEERVCVDGPSCWNPSQCGTDVNNYAHLSCPILCGVCAETGFTK